MSENGENQKNERADTGPKWVWWSTVESYERGAISVLACAEVAAGIWLYWWLIPWWFETNLHLLISVLVAPLLLLRSPASVGAAFVAFERYLDLRAEGFSLRSVRIAVAMFLAAGLSVLVSWGMADTWLSGHDGWSLFWRAGIICYIGVQIGIAVAVAVAGVVTGAIVAALNIALAGAVTGVVAVAGVLTGAGVLAGGVAGVGALAVYGGGIEYGGGTGARAGVLAGVLIGSGIILGIWFRSVIIRIGSTIRQLKEGWRRLSVNWRGLVWAHDLRRPPELLPGIERHPELRVYGIGSLLYSYKSEFGAERVFAIVLAAISLPIYFLPAWLYRLSLKSTCWFWWPLVFSQTSGRTAAAELAEGDNSRAGVLFEENLQTWLAKFVAGLSLILWVVAIGVPEKWLARLSVSKGDIDLLGALGDMIYLMLPCAGVQLALFLLCDRYLARAKAGHLGSWPRTAFLWLFNLRQLLLGSALVAAFVLLLENWVPGFSPLAELVETHYFSLFPILTWT